MKKFKSIEDVWHFLEQLPMFSKVGASASNFGIENIRSFCSAIGNPQEQIKTIHIAGTNGKGTVTLLLEAIYRENGYTTGAFTSPHLLKYNERVKISGKDISDDKLLEFFQTFEIQLKKIPLTYFELSTAFAFWAFADAQVDIAIIEAGLGGRLDSTNIIIPECTVITSIGLDHQAMLGSTKNEIAVEKSGIIKKGIPLILGNIEGLELQEIVKIAYQKHSEIIYSSNYNATFNKGEVYLKFSGKPIQTNFIEPINASNIATVKSIIDALDSKFPVNDELFRKVIETFPGVPARFEKLLADRDWYFTGAHNADAITSLMNAMNRFHDCKINFILSFMKDKISLGTMHPFKGFENLYFYEQQQGRAAKLMDISTFLNVKPIKESSFKRILQEMKLEVVIFAGSFYFYPIVKRWMTHFH